MLEIYPLTIIADRYNGAYSDGVYLAFNLYPCDIPMDIFDGDMEADWFWQNESDKYIIGKGNTPMDAFDDLKNKLP